MFRSKSRWHRRGLAPQEHRRGCPRALWRFLQWWRRPFREVGLRGSLCTSSIQLSTLYLNETSPLPSAPFHEAAVQGRSGYRWVSPARCRGRDQELCGCFWSTTAMAYEAEGPQSTSFFGSILEPGSSFNPIFLLVVDATFASLFFVLVACAVLTQGNIHLVFLTFIELALWMSVKWYVIHRSGSRRRTAG
jgi:hypothetical protein